MVQALEGKDVKDLLLNVGSGGGAAPAAGGAAAAASGDAPAEEKAAEKEEGTLHRPPELRAAHADQSQRRRSLTTTWALGCSTKRLPFTFPSPFAFVGVFKTGQRMYPRIFPPLGQRSSGSLLYWHITWENI